LYALGIVLYEAICGKRPFEEAARDTASLLAAILTEPVQPPQLVASDIPARLNNLVIALLEKDPGRRPTSARVVADELDDVLRELHGESVQSRLEWAPARASAPTTTSAQQVVEEAPKRAVVSQDRETADFPMPTATSVDQVTADFPMPMATDNQEP
jgi:serine/threonine-protein kinase